MHKFEFEITGTVGPTGLIELAYIRLRRGPVAKTVEIDGDRLLADYNKDGKLVGLEVLAPFKAVKLRGILSADEVEAIKRALPAGLKAA